MLEATLYCSGPDCEEILEVPVDDLSELPGLTCDCGYGTVLLAVVELDLQPASSWREASRTLTIASP